MPYRLKQEFEAFEVVSEGPWEGRKFRHGESYDEVPELEAHKFERFDLPGPATAEAPRRRKGGDS